MNEEEKEAIEILKKKLNYCELEYEQNGYLSVGKFNAIKEAVSLIDRLQKELEQEKEKNKTLEKALAVANRLEIEIKKNFVNKDKIKDKIKELKEQLEHTNTMEWQEIIKKQIEVLEDLLKEN